MLQREKVVRGRGAMNVQVSFEAGIGGITASPKGYGVFVVILLLRVLKKRWQDKSQNDHREAISIARDRAGTGPPVYIAM